MNDKNINQSFGKILVVDDEETTRRSLADILRLEGYQVKAVSDGEAALEALRVANRPGMGTIQEGFDVILLDLKMPGMDGMDVLKAAARIDPDIMIILLTAHGSLESAIEAIQFQAHDYILKPTSPQQITNSVTKAINRRAELLHKHALIEQKRAAISDDSSQPQNGESGRNLPLPGDDNKPVKRSNEENSQSRTEPSPYEPRSHEPRLIALANDVVVDLARREVWRQPLPSASAFSVRTQKAGERAQGNELHYSGVANARVRLTPTEGKLLKVLLENRGRVLTHRELVLMVQGYDITDWEAPEVLRPLVSRLRQKLKRFPGGNSWIVNVRGTGYVLERRQQDHGPTNGVERRQRKDF